MLNLQAHSLTLTARARFGLDGFQQRGGNFFVGVKLVIAGDAKVPMAEDGRAWEKFGQEMGDQFPHEEIILLVGIGAGQFDQARQHAGHLHHRQALASLAGFGDFQLHHGVKRFVDQPWEWMSGVQTQRCEHRAGLGAIKIVHPSQIGRGKLLEARKANTAFGQFREQLLAPAGVLARNQKADLALNGLQGLRGRETIRAAFGGGAFDLLFKTGHSGFEELIQIGAENAKELNSFQQRHGRVQGLLQDALIELQPTQLPVEQVFGDGAGGRLCHGFTYPSRFPAGRPRN